MTDEYLRFTQFCEDAAEVERWSEILWERVDSAIDKALEARTYAQIKSAIDAVERWLPDLPAMDKQWDHCKAELAHFTRDELYEDRDPTNPRARWRIRRDVVKEQVIRLIDSFPTSGVPNLRGFMQAMIEDLHAERVHPINLEEACRKIRRSAKKVPTIAEMMAAVEEADDEWVVRLGWLEGDSPSKLDEHFRTRLEELRALLAEVSPPPANVVSTWKAGDRFRHAKFGAGEVVAVDGNKLTAEFERAGRKIILDSFAEPA